MRRRQPGIRVSPAEGAAMWYILFILRTVGEWQIGKEW